MSKFFTDNIEISSNGFDKEYPDYSDKDSSNE